MVLCLFPKSIGLISLSSFSAAAILLAGLFCYDIFWVFGTEVMVRELMEVRTCKPLKLATHEGVTLSTPQMIRNARLDVCNTYYALVSTSLDLIVMIRDVSGIRLLRRLWG